ncbi:MAG: hypothetical protein ACI9FJ_003207 [Alteromonadaceae bacterium]|jgi:hypothetical protein
MNRLIVSLSGLGCHHESHKWSGTEGNSHYDFSYVLCCYLGGGFDKVTLPVFAVESGPWINR